MDQPLSDLDACEREAIHIPGAIQPHGALLVLKPDDLSVTHASGNIADYIGPFSTEPGELPKAIAPFRDQIGEWHASREPSFQIRMGDGKLVMTGHRSGQLIILEFEEVENGSADRLFAQLRGFAQVLAGQAALDGALSATSEFLRDLTGFDRVLVYRFDEDWNGHVIAEAGNGKLPSYLDLRFPAADIPAQARALYASNRLRLIPNVDYQPVVIEPLTEGDNGFPLDLSHAQLRSVSPVHLEYMRNMGTAASMSVSIIIGGRFWGLVSFHSFAPHRVSLTVRECCDFIVQSLASRIASQMQAQEAASRVDLGAISARLLTAMSGAGTWLEGLFANPQDLLAQVGAAGAAIIDPEGVQTAGVTPSEADILGIKAWLEEKQKGDLFHTNSLSGDIPQATEFSGEASGILAIRLSELHANWLIWFRPEIVKTVLWGGDPHKVVREKGRIHPRQSFEAWREQVRRQSAPWSEAEISAARDLRGAIVGIVLRKAEELADVSRELQRSNRELEAFSYSISHDLRAPFRHIVGFAQLLRDRESGLDDKSRHYLQTISDSALAAGRLVDDLLNFSQLGLASITHKPVDMNKLVEEVVKSVSFNIDGRRIDWQISALPQAYGDATLLRQVWFNLIENAVKYTRPRDTAQIRIEGLTGEDSVTYRVRDNGVGFDMTYVNKLFGVFQRLQRAEDFEGTGIGLALVRRIVERHNGTVSGEGELDKGATFAFTLPGPNKKGRAFG